jgi:hypothetical protein
MSIFFREFSSSSKQALSMKGNHHRSKFKQLGCGGSIISGNRVQRSIRSHSRVENSIFFVQVQVGRQAVGIAR